MQPIGFARTNMKLKFDAPHQPRNTGENGVIELVGGNNFEAALCDLEGFSFIWIIWLFHKSNGWKPKVLPPRGEAIKRGVFAARTPNRPNPIGLTAVRLLEVRGRKLIIGPSDLLDNTTVLDIKPYLKEIDSIPDATSGWVSNIKETKNFDVEKSEIVSIQSQWLLENFNLNFLDEVVRILSLDPTPHKTRRIYKRGEVFWIGSGAFRVYFEVKGKQVKLLSIAPGYPDRLLSEEAPHLEMQLKFKQTFGDDSFL
jgi:tRNA-Thr(GGU) m(6)t(6)A37 methyltransferase TsaA